MVKTEIEQVDPRSKLFFRRQALQAVDKKILRNPPYTRLCGVSAPTRISWARTPDEMFGEMKLEGNFQSTTPEDMYDEMQSEQKDSTAEQIFEDISVAIRYDKAASKGGRRGDWERNCEITRRYFFTAATAEEIGRDFYLGRKEVNMIVIKVIERAISRADGNPDGSRDKKRGRTGEGKPWALWNRRNELVDDESRLSKLLQALEDGKSAAELNAEFGFHQLSIMRVFFKDLGLDFKIPHKDLMLDPEYLSSLEKLDEPNPFRNRDDAVFDFNEIEQEKEWIMKRITRGMLQTHGMEKLHVKNIASVVKHLPCTDPRDIHKITEVLTGERIFVHEIPNMSYGKHVGSYYFIANGDVEYALQVLRRPEFADLRTQGR